MRFPTAIEDISHVSPTSNAPSQSSTHHRRLTTKLREALFEAHAEIEKVEHDKRASKEKSKRSRRKLDLSARLEAEDGTG